MKCVFAASLLSVLVWAGFSYGKINPFSEDLREGIDQQRNEGYVAFIVNETEAEELLARPHPDVDKCACKGTGYIWHGDGHQTKCPYHEEPDDIDDDEDEDDKKHRCKCDTRRTYCNCKATYGECRCKKL